MRNSETIQNVNFHNFGNYDQKAGCDRIRAAGKHAGELRPDRKCAVPSYALPGVETFSPCKVWVLCGICVTGGLNLVLGSLLLDLVEAAAVVVHPVVVNHGGVHHGGVHGMSGTAGDIVGVLHVELGEGLHVGGLVLNHLQLVLGSTCLVAIAELDHRLVTEEACGMADTAVDIVGVLLGMGPDGGLHVRALVLVHLQVVLGGTQPVGVAVDNRQVSGEASSKHPKVDAFVHLERLVHHEPGRVVDHLVYLEGGCGVLVLGPHDGMLVVGVVLHAAAVYMPSSPPGVAVGPDMNLVFGVHHLVSAGPGGGVCSHSVGWRGRPACWGPCRT
jgi:hypothetical protein